MTKANRHPLVLSAAVSAQLSACQCQTVATEPDPPPLPSGVPANAVWVGGIDGGDCILLSPVASDGTYSAKIYNDHSGNLEFSGKLRLAAPSTAPSTCPIRRRIRIGMATPSRCATAEFFGRWEVAACSEAGLPTPTQRALTSWCG